jgi:hypothetical protein
MQGKLHSIRPLLLVFQCAHEPLIIAKEHALQLEFSLILLR